MTSGMLEDGHRLCSHTVSFIRGPEHLGILVSEEDIGTNPPDSQGSVVSTIIACHTICIF